MPTEFPLPRGFQPAPVPDRLAFRVGGALRSRPSYLVVQTVFKTTSAPGRLTLRIGVSAASRTPISGFGGQGSVQLSYGNVMVHAAVRRRCSARLPPFGARSGDRTPSCGAHEAPAVPSGSTREVVRVGGIEPPLSCARGMRFSGLSYTLMATRRGFDPLSPVRQTGRLARCVTGQIGVRGAI
jgi:hypothetical protein